MSSSKLPVVDFHHIDHGIGSNSEALRNSKVLLTGPSGFFGTWMLETLVWLNTSKSLNMAIHVVVRNTIAFKKGISSWTESQIKIIEGDLSTLIITPDTYKYIIHLASDQIRSDDVTSLFNHMNRSVSAANNLIELAKMCETDSILFTVTTLACIHLDLHLLKIFNMLKIYKMKRQYMLKPKGISSCFFQQHQ
jgi:dTDP-glucose 4,6-dehydratase